MKILCSILSILVVVFSCLPCADVANGCKEPTLCYKDVNTSTNPVHNHADACSPFCHCTCCAGFSINHFITPSTLLVQPFYKPTIYFHSSAVTQIAFAFWQPPRSY